MYRQIAALVACLICGSAHASIGSWIEPNLGQTDSAARAVARDGDLTLLLEPQRARILIPASGPIEEHDGEITGPKGGALLELVMHGADTGAGFVMGQQIGGISRYFHGNNAETWLGRVPHHDSVRFTDVYPGIDLVYRLRGGRIEYDFEIDAGADPSVIQLSIRGAESTQIDASGDWVTQTPSGKLVQRAPEVFVAADDGLQPVPGRFERDGDLFGFSVTPTPIERMIIDPVIEFSSYLGGSGDEFAWNIAINSRDNLIVSGSTNSVDMPGAPPDYMPGGQDLYVAEIERSSGQLLWITFFGGSGIESADSMELDSQDNIVVAGLTDSEDLATVNAFQDTLAGTEDPELINFDGMIVKLNGDGSQLVFSSYYGGVDWALLSFTKIGTERLSDVFIDENDHIHVVGQTAAPDFPVTTSFLARTCMQGDDTSSVVVVSDIALIEFAPDGTRLFATCIGGSSEDRGTSIERGPDGRFFIGGSGNSGDLPTSVDAFQPVPPGQDVRAALVLKLDQARTDIEWGTYVGGTGVDSAGIAVAPDGSVVGSGLTHSTDFPVTPDALQPVLNAGLGYNDNRPDGFVFRLSSDGTTLDYATYFGGSDYDSAGSPVIDAAGRIFFAGITCSRDLMERTSLQPGPRRLFGSTLSIETATTVNALAITELTGPWGFEDRSVIAARDGVNRYHVWLVNDDYLSFDIGVESENSVDVVVGDFSSQAAFDDLAFINAFAPNSVYEYSTTEEDYVFSRHFGSASNDSRAAVRLFDGDVVVANYGTQNEIFSDATGTPVAIGRSDGNTVDVVNGSFGGIVFDGDLIFANRGQDVRLYRSIGFRPYDTAVILSKQSPNVSVLETGDINGDDTTDLVIGNSPGPLQVVTFTAGSPGAVQDIVGSDAQTLSLELFDIDLDGDLDLLAGNDGPDHLYYNDGSGGFTMAAELPVIAAPTKSILTACANFCEPWIGGSAGLSRYKRTEFDTYLAVIDSDSATLEFSSYLDSGAWDAIGQFILLEGGEILLAASARADSWPVPGDAAVAFADWEAVLGGIDIDIDDDTVIDGSDNCLEVANPLQRDTDNDAFGNFCDPDLNNDGAVNFADLQLFKQRIFGNDPDADLDGDGIVNFADLQIAKAFIFGTPGPSGLLLP